jgi:tetratricopeptide (TPR) repeat protein
LLTGRPPFRGETPLSTLKQVVEREPERPRALNPAVDRDLEIICLKCLQKEPTRRYPSAEALADDLERWQRGEPIHARPATRRERLWRWCRRKPAQAALVVVFVAGFLGVAGQWWRAETQKAEAERERNQAARQKAEAETSFRQALEVVDRFCTDVSQNVLLHEPGMQPLRRKLLAAAREYYREFVRRRSDDPGLRLELGKVYLRLARLTEDLDSRAAARALYKEAVAHMEQLDRDYPGVPAHRHQLAVGYGDLAGTHRRDEAAGWAEALYRKALAMEGRLAEEDPANSSYLEALAGLNQGLGNHYTGAHQLTEAETRLKEALGLRRRVAGLSPDNANRAQEHLARAYEDLARVYYTRGRMDRAGRLWEQARDTRQRLSRKDPHSPEHAAALGACLCELGELYRLTKGLTQAERTLKEALKHQDKLAADNPRVTRYQRALATTHHALAATYLATGQPAESEKEFARALAIRQRLADAYPDEPDFRLDLANAHQYVARMYINSRRPAEAQKAFGRALDILAKLTAAYRDQPDYQFAFADALNALGTLHKGQDDLAEARKVWTRARALLLGLTQDHPGVLDYQYRLLMTGYNLGLVYKDMDRFDRAEEAFRETLRKLDDLIRAHPTFTGFAALHARAVFNLGEVLRDRGHILGDRGKLQDALPWYDKAEEALQKMLRVDARSAHNQDALRNVYWGRAQALGFLGRHAEALRDWDRTLKIEKGEFRDQVRLLRAATQAQLGDHAAATATADELAGPPPPKAGVCHNRARVYALAAQAARRDQRLKRTERTALAARHAARAVKLLGQAYGAGYFKDESNIRWFYKDPAFAPLREDAGFQKLRAELEKKLPPQTR